MIELPEAVSISGQLNDTVFGKRIAGVTAVHTPHKLAWYYGEPSTYFNLIAGRTVGKASPFGSLVEIGVENANIRAKPMLQENISNLLYFMINLLRRFFVDLSNSSKSVKQFLAPDGTPKNWSKFYLSF